jgi:ribosome recycling factor
MNQIEDNMKKSIDVFKKNLIGIRTSRANPDILTGITVTYYGSKVPLQEVASISVPESQVLLLNVFDKTALKEIVKSIESANLGFNPMVDDNLIRIQLPDLTEDRRKELAKQAKRLSEDSKVSIRHIRRDAIDTIKNNEKNKEITEDDSKKQQTEAQLLTDTHIQLIDTLLLSKEKEILTI